MFCNKFHSVQGGKGQVSDWEKLMRNCEAQFCSLSNTQHNQIVFEAEVALLRLRLIDCVFFVIKTKYV